MADELAEAAAILFTRAADLEDNMGQIRACLRVRRRRRGKGKCCRSMMTADGEY